MSTVLAHDAGEQAWHVHHTVEGQVTHQSVEGIVGPATPIIDATGAVNAAVHISAPRGRLSADRLPAVLTEMLRAAAAISEQLGAPDGAIGHRSVDEIIDLGGSRGGRDERGR